MKKLFFIVTSCVLFWGCSSSDSTPEVIPSISQTSSLRAKIGDVIRLSGSDLSGINQVNFEYADASLGYNDIPIYNFTSQTDDYIELRVPDVIHEDLVVKLVRQNTGVNLKVVGFIPIPNNMDVDEKQVINNDVAFIRDGNSLYRSSNGMYQWEKIYDAPGDFHITSFFFLNETQGWVSLSNNFETAIYYSDDGGQTFNLKIQVNNVGSGSIRKMQFISSDVGFFVDQQFNMFKVENNTFTNVYDLYPSLSALSIGRVDIWRFKVINNDLFFMTPNSSPNLIRVENQNATAISFNHTVLPPQFFGNVGYIQSNSDIYKSTDLGRTWTLSTTFAGHYPNIQFFDENTGFALVNYNPFSIYKTVDGGDTWHQYWTPSTNTYYNTISTRVNPKHVWLFSDLWKYIEE
jgi:hypothetical protein